ncbi:CotY/CotZ family spore coat protein [Bacillus sp. FJAT-27445]|uniref:CotY/CotZ family spore coat protein n=1 Tax=Bacillus sp. FJAT-27445 TaxID=1679166 RepID=UPI0034621CAE
MLKENKPICLYTECGNPFKVFTCFSMYCVDTPVFIVKKIDKKKGCIVLSPLVPVDIEGCPVDFCPDLYSLEETNAFFTFQTDCICGIIGLPSDLVNRYLPPIHPKC